MDMLILIPAGLLAGFVNTVAGAGSLFTLPALIFSGLDANAANATNRIAVLVQNAVALGVYRRKGLGGLGHGLKLCVPAVVFAVAGALVATRLSETAMRVVIALCMITFVPLSFRLHRKLRLAPARPIDPQPNEVVSHREWWMFAAIGFFGGFVQAGVGILILLTLALGSRMNLVIANHIKTLVVLLLTVGAVITFVFLRAHIDLFRGLVLGAATMVGSFLGAHESLRRGERFIAWVTVGVVLLAAAKLLVDVVAHYVG